MDEFQHGQLVWVIDYRIWTVYPAFFQSHNRVSLYQDGEFPDRVDMGCVLPTKEEAHQKAIEWLERDRDVQIETITLNYENLIKGLRDI